MDLMVLENRWCGGWDIKSVLSLCLYASGLLAHIDR